MPMLPQPITASDIPERSDYTPLPNNTYTLMVTASEMKQNGQSSKDPNGQQLVLTIDVVEGEMQGRKLFERLNLVNTNNETVEIAYKTLGELTRACGKNTITSSEDLHNIRFLGDVVVTPANGGYGPGNKIKKYHSLGSGQAAAAQSPASGAPAARPWAKK